MHRFEPRRRAAALVVGAAAAEAAVIGTFWAIAEDLQRDWRPVLTLLGLGFVALFAYWAFETVTRGVSSSSRGPALRILEFQLTLYEVVQIGAIPLAIAVLLHTSSDILAYAIGGTLLAFLLIRLAMRGT